MPIFDLPPEFYAINEQPMPQIQPAAVPVKGSSSSIGLQPSSTPLLHQLQPQLNASVKPPPTAGPHPSAFEDTDDEDGNDEHVNLAAMYPIQQPFKNNTIFVGLLDSEVTIDDLWGHFSRYGEVEKVSIHKIAKRPAYGFVTFNHGSGVLMALAVTHRTWNVSLAKY